MATLETRLRDLATRVGTECKAIRTLTNGNATDLAALTTTAKGNLVAALNEVNAKPSGGASINDAATNTTAVWSTALGDDANFAATMTTALGNRVRVDTAAQGLTTQQKTNARTNIDAYGSVEIGNPDTDFVGVFNTAVA
jgi:hypothetical protein